MPTDELDYETHSNRYKSLFGKTPAAIQRAEQQALHLHALAVLDALRDSFFSSVTVQEELRSHKARYYMLYGAGRRLNMMWRACRDIVFTIPPDRTDPLSVDEERALSVDINVIYMHLRGVLDNYTWCYLYEKDPAAANSLSPLSVGLFSKPTLRLASFSVVADKLGAHRTWYEEIKQRRDPVAHRIPLYIPSTAVTPDEAEKYRRKHEEFWDSTCQLDFDKAELIKQEMTTIGRFFPHFVHHPEEGTIPIYPTVPTDMVHLIRIGRIIQESLRQ